MKPLKKVDATPLPWLEALLRNGSIKGAQGERGLRGERGLDGADGRDGLDGVDGQDGRPGADGRDGVDGKDGADGKRGLKGLRGLRGLQGRQGKPGKDGKDGLAGKVGAKGDKGDKGDPPKHQIDKENNRIRFERPDGGWGAWIDFKLIVKHITTGAGTHPKVSQDIEALRSGKYPDYSRVTVVTANTTLTDFHRIVVCKSNAMTITLPPAATYFNSKYSTGIVYTVANDKANANDITLAADGSELIDDANTWTIPPGSAPKVVTDGSKWHII